MAQNSSIQLIREKLEYAEMFINLETFYSDCDKYVASLALNSEEIITTIAPNSEETITSDTPNPRELMDISAQAESKLATQRSRIVDAGGYIIDTTFSRVINSRHGESTVSNLIEEIKNKIELALPNTTKFDIEEGGEDVPLGSHVLYVFTDRKLITKVLKIINDATGNAYELTPFRHTKIKEEHQSIAGLSTIEDCKTFIDRYKCRI